jgi:predicted TIM-barrel fold metal-dependent hydrolase
MRAVDFHVHVPMTEWLDGSLGRYRAPAERYFRQKVETRTAEAFAQEFVDRDLVGVVLAWDAETATRQPALKNDFVADLVRRFPRAFVGFASVDPHKGEAAVRELERAVTELGLKGAKFHPSLQAFDPSDPRFFPLWEKCAALGLPCIFHTGTSGIGAGTPGGQGVRIDYARPILLDPVAAAFPEMTIVAAHFGWPWHLELIAMALHKTNVYLELSGWAPRYLPPEVVREIGGRLQRQTLFGSDYPFISPDRWLQEFPDLGLKSEAAGLILKGNACRLLGLEG